MTWLLPSRRRVGNLKRFFRACRETGLTTGGLVLINADELAADQASYTSANLDLPPNWEVRGVVAGSMHDALRAALPEVINDPWVGLLQDDLVPQTADWDGKLIGALNGWNVVSADDGRGTGRMHGAIVWSGELVRALGWLYPPGFQHLYGDNVWETLGAECLCWQRRSDVITHHLNETYALAPDDTAKHIANRTEHDQRRFTEWAAHEKDDAVRKISTLREARGFRMVSADMENVQLAIATPCGSGRYEGNYKDSLEATMDYFRARAIPVGLLNVRGHAEISLARSKLFSAFLRSSATHLLWIDDDMGWDVASIIKLFAAGRDFVAAAGPKKSYPIKYAANHTDDDGAVLPLIIDRVTGLAKVTEVGLAFALITRACAERIAGLYPELRFNGPNGEVECAPFIPMVRHGRYLPEDFSFCQRWRAVGGEIFLAADVRLRHTGAHTFEGAVIDSMRGNS